MGSRFHQLSFYDSQYSSSIASAPVQQSQAHFRGSNQNRSSPISPSNSLISSLLSETKSNEAVVNSFENNSNGSSKKPTPLPTKRSQVHFNQFQLEPTKTLSAEYGPSPIPNSTSLSHVKNPEIKAEEIGSNQLFQGLKRDYPFGFQAKNTNIQCKRPLDSSLEKSSGIPPSIKSQSANYSQNLNFSWNQNVPAGCESEKTKTQTKQADAIPEQETSKGLNGAEYWDDISWPSISPKPGSPKIKKDSLIEKWFEEFQSKLKAKSKNDEGILEMMEQILLKEPSEQRDLENGREGQNEEQKIEEEYQERDLKEKRIKEEKKEGHEGKKKRKKSRKKNKKRKETSQKNSENGMVSLIEEDSTKKRQGTSDDENDFKEINDLTRDLNKAEEELEELRDELGHYRFKGKTLSKASLKHERMVETIELITGVTILGVSPPLPEEGATYECQIKKFSGNDSGGSMEEERDFVTFDLRVSEKGKCWFLPKDSNISKDIRVSLLFLGDQRA